MLFISILLTIISLYLFKQKIHSSVFSIINAISIFILFLFYGFWWTSNHFTGQGINEAIIFHLYTDLSGAGFFEFKYYFILGVIYIFAILIIALYSYKLVYLNQIYLQILHILLVNLNMSIHTRMSNSLTMLSALI